LKRHSQFEYRNKIYQGKKKLPCPALPCALAALRAIRAGQKKKFCPAGQGRASGRADCPALMTVSVLCLFSRCIILYHKTHAQLKVFVSCSVNVVLLSEERKDH
jgi:hypothetical protein